jgi:hypothetical protein
MTTIPIHIKLREKHRGDGGYCHSCKPQMRYPCDVMRLVTEYDRVNCMVKNAQGLLKTIGSMTITRLDRRGEGEGAGDV